MDFREDFKHKLRSSLELVLPYPERPQMEGGTPAAVLVLFGLGGEAQILITRRAESVETHKGQMAFPGGKCEQNEIGAPGEIYAALRETHEEVGIAPSQVEILGILPKLWTITGFWVTPVVGVLTVPIQEIVLTPSRAEIADVFWVPLSKLQARDTYRKEFVSVGSIRYPTHVFQVGEHRIWGATGSMLRNILDRLGQLERV
ncbi:CoA pyrophosphatase [Bdellovibrionota bacterium FG-2]